MFLLKLNGREFNGVKLCWNEFQHLYNRLFKLRMNKYKNCYAYIKIYHINLAHSNPFKLNKKSMHSCGPKILGFQ